MQYSVYLTKTKQMELFSQIGLDGLYLSQNPACEDRPIKILSINEKTADDIYAVYGTPGDVYDEETCVLEIHEGTALNLFAEMLGLQPNLLEKVIFVDEDTIQLMISGKALAKSSRTVFAARCRNLLTGHDEILFTTELSAFLARNRGIEKAAERNERNASRGLGRAFNIEDIVIVQRKETTLTAKGVWTPVPKTGCCLGDLWAKSQR